MSSFHLFSRKLLIGLGSALCCFLLSSGVVAQETGELRGQVTTTDSQPVTDAIVTVVGTRARVQVDGQGRFTLDSVAAGPDLCIAGRYAVFQDNGGSYVLA